MNNSRKFQELDSLRALAVILVLFLHFSTAFLYYNNLYDTSVIDSQSLLRQAQLIMGAKGVLLFFSLSGFLIVYLLKRKGFSQFNYRAYITRRFWRLHPPYVAALIFFFLVHLYLGEYDLLFLTQSFLASLFYSHDLFFNHWSYILPVAWSLEIEIQYYLIVPLILYITYKLNKLPIVLLFYVALLLYFTSYSFFNFRNLSGYLQYFIPGMIIAELYYSNLLIHKKSVLFDFIFTLSLFVFVLSETSIFDPLILLLIFYSIFNLKYLLNIMHNKVLNFIGRISFSIYLLHYPLFHLFMKLFTNKFTTTQSYTYDMILQWLIFLPLTIVFVYPFYYFFESPYIKNVSFINNIKQCAIMLKLRFRS